MIFAAESASVMMVDINEPGLQATLALIQRSGGTAAYSICDVTDRPSIAAVVEQTRQAFSPVAVLVNNAGIMPEGSVLTTTEETWHRVIETNLTSMFHFAQEVVPDMKREGIKGSIVNIASVQGLLGHPQRLAYVTSKHGVIGFTRALAADLSSASIRVNAICPGTIDTPMLQRELDKVPPGDRAATLDGYRQLHPLGEIGRPEDIAYAALFLASDESRFVTGTVLPVDGGYTSLIVHQ
jgi:NAD(P)-dependent dehydrogenase (short-subunit alcohol dehydrogenase family)